MSESTPYTDETMAQYFARASAKLQFDQPGRDLAEWLQPADGQLFLDVGSGSGAVSYPASEFVQPSGLVLALDSSIEMLKQQIKSDVVLPVAGSAPELPFQAETFHRIAAAFVISHLADYRKSFSEWFRVLRAKGILGVTTWKIE